MKKITKEQFLEAFENEWRHQVGHNWKQIDTDWTARTRIGEYETPWTQFMLNKCGFLDLVRISLKKNVSTLDYYKEMYFLDAVYVAGVDLYSNDLTYPSSLPVISIY